MLLPQAQRIEDKVGRQFRRQHEFRAVADLNANVEAVVIDVQAADGRLIPAVGLVIRPVWMAGDFIEDAVVQHQARDTPHAGGFQSGGPLVEDLA